MPYGEGGYRSKTTKELSGQLNTAQDLLGREDENFLVPPSLTRKEILQMPFEELRTKYARRFKIYAELLRKDKRVEAGQDEQLSDEDVLEMKKWIIALNALDQYILDHKRGKDSTLYERQATVFDDARKFLEAGGTEGYIKLPTGSGKTVLFTEFVKAINLKTLVVVPRELLIEQTENQFNTHAPDLDVGKVSGRAKEFGHQVTIITYDSLLNQLESGHIKPNDFECLILDEVHMSLSEKRMEAVKKFDSAIKLGFTATPQYSESKKVGNLLGKEIHRMNIREAIEDEGMLCSMSAIVVRTQVDLSSVQIDSKRNDYDVRQLDRAVNVAGRNQKAVELYKKNFNGQTAVVFCVGVKHAEEVARLYNMDGVSAAVVSGQTKNIPEILERYKTGEIKVLCNADILIAGFDEPLASVCINLRPTRSRVVAEQRGGRVLRPSEADPSKHAYILDFIDKDIPDDRLPVLFADVAEGAQFLSNKTIKGTYSGGGGVRPPILSIPGLDVIADEEEVMRIVRQIKDVDRDIGLVYRSGASALLELEAAFTAWQALPMENRLVFSSQWLLKNGYSSLYHWTRRNIFLSDLVDRSNNTDLKKYFIKSEVGISRTPESALLELEEAFSKWQAVPTESRGKFNTNWLINNGYIHLQRWAERPNGISLPILVARSKNAELKMYFSKRIMSEAKKRTQETALLELEEAFQKWQTVPAEARSEFNVRWLQQNGYSQLYYWTYRHTALVDLVTFSDNDKLKKCFIKKEISEAKKRTQESALLELEEAFQKWQAIPIKVRPIFNTAWLVGSGYKNLYEWTKRNTSLIDLVAQTNIKDFRPPRS